MASFRHTATLFTLASTSLLSLHCGDPGPADTSGSGGSAGSAGAGGETSSSSGGAGGGGSSSASSSGAGGSGGGGAGAGGGVSVPVLDATFGDGGVVTTNGGPGNGDRIYAVARQADGKVILAGTTGVYEDFFGPHSGESLLMRVAADGSLDPTFGNGGKVLTTVGLRADEANAVLVQPDQKILVVGHSSRVNTQAGLFLARHLPGGELDPTFGQGGVVVAPKLNARQIYGSVTFAPDGKIVVRGVDNTDISTVVVRFLPDGSLDPAFGTAGVQKTFSFAVDYAGPTLVLPDGKVLGASVVGSGAAQETRVFRLLENGAVDSAFGQNGNALASLGPAEEAPAALAVAADGSIFVGGRANSANGFTDGVVVHLSASGVLDAGFAGGTGKVLIAEFGPDQVDELQIDEAGRILARALINKAPFTVAKVLRFLPDGTLDTTFGTAGTAATVPLGAGMVRGAGGEILVAGTQSSADATDPVVTRLTSAGAPDATFGTAGVATFNSGATRDVASHVVVQPDGKLLVAGMIATNGRRVALMRHLPDGSLDTTYGSGGRVRVDAITQSAGFVRTADGGSLVAGYPGGAIKFGVARHDASGKLDTAFGTAGIASATVDPGGDNAVPYALALDAAGNAIVGGATGFSDVCAMGLVRFTPAGALDATFDGDGRLATVLPEGGFCAVRSLIVQPDGKILALGFRGGQLATVVLRYLPNGMLDTTFGVSGIAEVKTPDFLTDLDQMFLLPDGGIVIAGAPDGGSFVVARLGALGKTDLTFGDQGYSKVPLGGAQVTVNPYGLRWTGPAIVPLPDGSVYLAGAAVVETHEQMLVMKLAPDGALDLNFGTMGRFVAPVKPGNFAAYDMARQPDGKLVLAGRGYSPLTGSDFALVRFDP